MFCALCELDLVLVKQTRHLMGTLVASKRHDKSKHAGAIERLALDNRGSKYTSTQWGFLGHQPSLQRFVPAPFTVLFNRAQRSTTFCNGKRNECFLLNKFK